ncbi:MAG: glycoside hydrolase family 127 protein [Saprospiraceae bacterium]|nr:glycoside hydrolase family 127 protein [Saprospiraceae bacterium]MCB9320285.1 glycoside hydrolase family 127 protein [Lewinellaceae bacterium]
MKYVFLVTLVLTLLQCTNETPDAAVSGQPWYLQNREPLIQKPYLELPLGSIRPTGWLNNQLVRMANGLTGNLDSIYPEVVGSRNGWLGGDGDGWERGPYWIDGLLPLAYILNDETLKQKAQKWVEWTLSHQREDGYIGPVPFTEEPAPEPGLQRGMREDWWPKMVMLKILQQYYSATGDERVIDCLTRYFRYQLQELPERPLDFLTLWANRRGGDNLMVVYWLYNITGDAFLLELGDLINEQTFPWAKVFTNPENDRDPGQPWYYSQIRRYPFDTAEINALTVSKLAGMHTVNFAQSLKQPVVYYQKSHDTRDVEAVRKALRDVRKYHGQPQGMYGGDEPLHGNNPVQGIEFCSIAEEMFSLETNLTITGDLAFADQIERIAFNALPTQADDDFRTRQYFQAANQVELTPAADHTFERQNHMGTDFVYGVLTGYPCCTCNMHQSWPKLVQNLYYATPDRGVAALLYVPSEVELMVGDSTRLRIVEETGYPFRENIHFTLHPEREDRFAFHLRVPAWCTAPAVLINGQPWEGVVQDGIVVIDRRWKEGDQVVLKLPMELKTSSWYQFARAIERGPLVYALRIESRETNGFVSDRFRSFTEVHAATPWNYALIEKKLNDPGNAVEVIENDWDGRYPWNLENAPVSLKMNAFRLPEWQLADGIPSLPAVWGRYRGQDPQLEEITLIPYGCTTLRITEFPVCRLE